MSKPAVLTLRIPSDLKARIADLAAAQGVSVNQFAMYVLTTKVTELDTHAFFEEVIGDLDSDEIRAEFLAVIDKVRRRPAPDDVPEWDRMLE